MDVAAALQAQVQLETLLQKVVGLQDHPMDLWILTDVNVSHQEHEGKRLAWAGEIRALLSGMTPPHRDQVCTQLMVDLHGAANDRAHARSGLAFYIPPEENRELTSF